MSPLRAFILLGLRLKDAEIWPNRWRRFYMAAAELFGYNHGNEYGVAHYRFARR